MQAGIQKATQALQGQAGTAGSTWLEAAQAIMTTDTQPKAASRRIQLKGQTISLTGISKVPA